MFKSVSNEGEPSSPLSVGQVRIEWCCGSPSAFVGD